VKILAVGGAGYVGGCVTDQLLEQGHEVRVFDLLLYEEAYLKDVDFIFGDIREEDNLRSHLEWADAVVWLAALVGDGACAIDPDITFSINSEPVRQLTENFDGRIIFFSTCSVYGAQEGILDENSAVNPLSVYAASKLEAEKHLAGKNALIFRLGTLFGVGDRFSRIRMDLVVNTLTVKAYTEGKLHVYGGEQYRPLLHVKDVAKAVTENVLNDISGIYNLNYKNVRILELAEQVKTHFPEVKIEKTEMPFQDSRNYCVTSKKAQGDLQFDPVKTVDDGINEIKYLLETKRIRDVNNVRYVNAQYLKEFKTHQ